MDSKSRKDQLNQSFISWLVLNPKDKVLICLAFFCMERVILLMEDILHQLIRRIYSTSIYSVSYIPGGAEFLPSTVSCQIAIFGGGGRKRIVNNHPPFRKDYPSLIYTGTFLCFDFWWHIVFTHFSLLGCFFRGIEFQIPLSWKHWRRVKATGNALLNTKRKGFRITFQPFLRSFGFSACFPSWGFRENWLPF